MRSFLSFSIALSLAACSSGGGGGKLPCDGTCGTLVTTVTLYDTTGAPATCASTGVADVLLTVLDENAQAVGTRTASCGATTELGPINVGTYTVDATARDATGTALGEFSRSSTLVNNGDRNDVEIPLVPGPPSKLGQACSGSCPAGYSCAQVDFGGTTTAFCTLDCGTAPVMSDGPMNGDFACHAGFSGPGIPHCALYGDGSGDVTWSCLLECTGGAGSCPTGMTCVAQSGSSSVCVNP